MSKIILLTGASGFLGSYVLKVLIKKKIKVRIITRKNKSFLFEDLENLESLVYSEDIFNESYDWWVNVFSNIDICIHMAWYVEHSDYLTSLKNFDCLNGTIIAGRAAREAGIRKFVGIGTCFEYDLSENKPLQINDRLKPETIYAACKVSAFNILNNLFKNRSTLFSWHRVFYIFGEGENKKKLFSYIKENLSKGLTVYLSNPDALRDFISVNEAAEMIVDSSLSDQEGPENICSGNPMTVKEFSEGVADLFGSRNLLFFDNSGNKKDFNPYSVVGKK